MKKIVASIIAESQNELDERVSKVNFAETIQLDVMDGKFVENNSLNFYFELPGTKASVEAHLMIENPIEWINKHGEKVDTIIVHLESNNVNESIKKIKALGKRAGIGMNPETPVDKIKDYLDKVEHVLVMTVHPGKYGAEFLPETLEKVKQVRELNSKIDIEVDGGMNAENIVKANTAGANLFVSGTYLQKSKNPEQVYKELKKLVK